MTKTVKIATILAALFMPTVAMAHVPKQCNQLLGNANITRDGVTNVDQRISDFMAENKGNLRSLSSDQAWELMLIILDQARAKVADADAQIALTKCISGLE